MQHLQHSWFDPTSLMSRTVQWDTLPSDFLQKKNILETLKSGLLSNHLLIYLTHQRNVVANDIRR